MPGNTIEINGVKKWYVGDSKMEALLHWLNKNGKRDYDKKKSEAVLISQDRSKGKPELEFVNYPKEVRNG